jgi:DNA-binding transcriptional ArsR family regulator
MVDARLFQALSDPTRLDILALLARGTINVSRIVAHLGCAQPAVSRHLRVLREVALISDRRMGKEVEYSINPGALAAAAEYLGGLVAGVESAAAVEGVAGGGGVEAADLAGVASPGSTEGADAARTRRPRARPTARPRTVRKAAAAVLAARTAPRAPSRAGDFAAKEADFVIKPRKKSGLDDFLL